MARVSRQVSKQENLNTALKATVTKRWCLEQLNTFSVSSKNVQGQTKLADM